MKTLNTISCIKIGKTEIKIIVLDLFTKKVIWRRAFTYDFEVFDNSGVIINRSHIASFIQDIFHQYKLPKRVRISLSLEYLSINNLLLPALSGPEFHQIILDEAAHESVYSFTDENIAVAYQILKNKRGPDGILNTEVFAVTTLQTAIDQVIEVFNLTDLKLESISPALSGLKQYLLQNIMGPHKPIILIMVANDDAEFYMWKGQLPYQCHFIKAGKKTPEALQNEVMASLEHFNKPTSGEESLSQVVVIGEKCEMQLGDKYSLKYLFNEEWPDLVGLGLNTNRLEVLNFLNPNYKTGFTTSVSIKWLCPVIIGGLIVINTLIGYNLWSIEHQLAQVKNEHSRLQNLLIAKRQQLGSNNGQQVSVKFNTDTLLKNLQDIITEDMMFDKLVVDIENKSMQVEGFCIDPKNLNTFLGTLSRIKGIKSVDELESSQQTRANIIGYAFRFIVTF